MRACCAPAKLTPGVPRRTRAGIPAEAGERVINAGSKADHFFVVASGAWRLTDEEFAAFNAAEFEFGCIPEKEPPPIGAA